MLGFRLKACDAGDAEMLDRIAGGDFTVADEFGQPNSNRN